jgi:hypothetical protein
MEPAMKVQRTGLHRANGVVRIIAAMITAVITVGMARIRT